MFRLPSCSTLFPYTTLFRSPLRAAPRAVPGRNRASRGCAPASPPAAAAPRFGGRSEEHTSELQSRFDLVCRLLLEKKKEIITESISDDRVETYIYSIATQTP